MKIRIKGRHRTHRWYIQPRIHAGRHDPVPGLYCADCGKWIKWMSYDETAELLSRGVEDRPMTLEHEMIWKSRENGSK